MGIKFLIALTIISFSYGCQTIGSPAGEENNEQTKPARWSEKFDQELPLLGHRNWIAIVDKAFPLQNAPGIEVINTNENLLPVLKHVLHKIHLSTHVRPILYRDKELGYIAENQASGLGSFLEKSEEVLNGQPIRTILHDSVFSKLDQASQLFKVIVFKTNEVIPYTSVFIELDCSYWDPVKETELRKKMMQQ